MCNFQGAVCLRKNNCSAIYPWMRFDNTGQCIINPQGDKVITVAAHTDRWPGHTTHPNNGRERRGSRFGLIPGKGYKSFSFSRAFVFHANTKSMAHNLDMFTDKSQLLNHCYIETFGKFDANQLNSRSIRFSAVTGSHWF